MTFLTLTPDMVEAIHGAVPNPGELPGRARDRSPEGALARVDNCLACGRIGDLFDLAAAHCVAVAQGHWFNDGTKRTAFHVMDAAPVLNRRGQPRITEEEGQVIIRITRIAQRQLEEAALADWLRDRA